MPFLTEPEPERGAVQPVMTGISRIVAANPGPMTYYGTNTYLIDTPDGIAVLDPGPEEGPVDRPVDDQRGDQTGGSHRAQKRGRHPVPVRDVLPQPAVDRAPPVQPRHVRLDPRLVEEDQSRRV